MQVPLPCRRAISFSSSSSASALRSVITETFSSAASAFSLGSISPTA